MFTFFSYGCCSFFFFSRSVSLAGTLSVAQRPEDKKGKYLNMRAFFFVVFLSALFLFFFFLLFHVHSILSELFASLVSAYYYNYALPYLSFFPFFLSLLFFFFA